MTRIRVLAVAALLLSASLASAQSYYYHSDVPGDPQTLVRSWYERYLRRQPDAGASAWVKELRSGHSADDVVSSILSSPEYYTASGGSAPGYIRQLYVDLIGRTPLPAEISFWMGRLRYSSRRDVAYQFLIRHPQNWSGLKAPPRNYNPGYYPDPASPAFPDPSGPYFHSPYFYNYEKSRPIRAFPLGAQG